jgi:hypothetical protein
MPEGPEKTAALAADDAAARGQRTEYFAQLDAIAAMRATTLAGFRAKARAINQHWGLVPPPESELAVSLVADLMALGALS